MMAIEIPQNEKISVGGKEGVGSAIRRKRANMENISVTEYGSSEEKEEDENSKKDRPCQTKIMTSLLARGLSGKNLLNRERVQSDCRKKYQRKQKEEEELKLDFRIQIRST